MFLRSKKPRAGGFTLVEMLVVVVIIGILAGLITGAVMVARRSARVGFIRSEIGQLEMTLQEYKNRFGEYPPDFAFTADDVPDALRIPARQRVIQHIRKRWPRFVPPPGTVDQQWEALVALFQAGYPNLGLNDSNSTTTTFSPATALVFWLGGLPEDPQSTEWRPQGFHSDPTNPMQPGLPREKPLFDFRLERIGRTPVAGYYPDIGGGETVPYVYFRSYRLAQTGRYEYGYPGPNQLEIVRFPVDLSDPNWNAFYGQAVPYLEPWQGMPVPAQSSDSDYAQPTLDRRWRNEESFQVLAPGLDGSYGIGLDVPAGPGNPSLYRFTRIGARFSDEDYDNLANFCQGTLQDEIE